MLFLSKKEPHSALLQLQWKQYNYVREEFGLTSSLWSAVLTALPMYLILFRKQRARDMPKETGLTPIFWPLAELELLDLKGALPLLGFWSLSFLQWSVCKLLDWGAVPLRSVHLLQLWATCFTGCSTLSSNFRGDAVSGGSSHKAGGMEPSNQSSEQALYNC